ncbi:FHA domain protein, partial [Chlamydia suis MD56]
IRELMKKIKALKRRQKKLQKSQQKKLQKSML